MAALKVLSEALLVTADRLEDADHEINVLRVLVGYLLELDLEPLELAGFVGPAHDAAVVLGHYSVAVLLVALLVHMDAHALDIHLLGELTRLVLGILAVLRRIPLESLALQPLADLFHGLEGACLRGVAQIGGLAIGALLAEDSRHMHLIDLLKLGHVLLH